VKRSYAWFWRITFVLVTVSLIWTQFGEAWVRRTYHMPPEPSDLVRTTDHFVAILFPRITKRPRPYAFSQDEFESVVRSLKSLGYYPIGFDDIRALYFEGRLLPPKSILIALDRDEPISCRIADKVMKKLKMRGAVFLKGGAEREGRYKRRWLSRHGIKQMQKSGTWTFGQELTDGPETDVQSKFVHVSDEGEIRFTVAQTGFNDIHQDPLALNIMRVRPDKEDHQNVLLVHKTQPRRKELVDDFSKSHFGSEWLIGWGAASAARGKMVILPMPGQSSAGVFLTGTEDWQDLVLEFTLERYKKTFWAYVRYQDMGRYLRVGIGNGRWQVQQKPGIGPPNVLGSLEVKPSDLPAKIRLLLKGNWATLYINDVMQFGKSLRVDPAIDRGRVHLGVYDKEPRTAIAVLSEVRVKPLGTKWLALSAQGAADPNVQSALREQLVEAAVISPRWFAVGPQGQFHPTTQERETVWFHAGYYRCRLIPLVDVASSGLDFERERQKAEAMQALMAQEAEELGVDGLNLFLTAEQAKNAGAFLEGLRNRLHAVKKELWITTKEPPHPVLRQFVDGLLCPVGQAAPGLDILETSDFVKPGTPRSPRAGSEVALWP
jgi:hypothetical protein